MNMKNKTGKISDVIEAAKNILKNNTYSFSVNKKPYRRIVPSREFYVHQWNWDSCTHAMGLVHYDEALAYDEIRSLLSGQWKNGLIAQITFNPKEKKYFPGPEFWGTEDFAVGEILTSGITQPPLLGVAVAYVYRMAKDRHQAESFLKEVLPRVLQYHEYLKKFRDPEGSGLLTIVHPWESGTDNSPRFDEALERIPLSEIPQEVKEIVRTFRTDDKEGDATHRPRINDYYRYMYLVSLFKSWHWDYERIVKESPFAMKDILFTSVWIRANQDIAMLLEEKGIKEGSIFQQWADEGVKALHSLWQNSSETFPNIDVAREKFTPVNESTIAGLLPLYIRGLPHDIRLRLVKCVTRAEEYYPAFPVPSTPLNNPHFDAHRYWRGSTWPITNYFLIDGLGLQNEDEDMQKLSELIRRKTLAMIQLGGFFEYYEPLTGKGIGFGSFSWTAAIFLLLAEKDTQ
jgi:hypothetical protein